MARGWSIKQASENVQANDNPTEVVVHHGGMIQMSCKDEAFLTLAMHKHLTYLEASRFKAGVNEDSVMLLRYRIAQFTWCTNSPLAIIVKEFIGNRIRQFLMNVKVLKQFFPAHFTVKRKRIGGNMKRMVVIINETLAIQGLQVCLMTSPLFRHRPGPSFSAGWHLMNRHRQFIGQANQSSIEIIRDQIALEEPELLD